MSDLSESGDGELTARFLFPPEFVGFQGHFPERPILPAVCEIQAAIAMLEASSKRRITLKEIVSAKFSMPVTCGEEVMYLCSVAMQDSQIAVLKTNVTKHGKSVAKFKLRVVFKGKT
jgi:3-hydroxyacyl-[acyl-carrier-protein] dehydratase